MGVKVLSLLILVLGLGLFVLSAIRLMWQHRRLREKSAPESERPAAHRGQEGPYCRICTPDKAAGGVGAALACDAVHDADDVVQGGGFLQTHIAVSHKDDPVFLSLYYPVDQVSAAAVQNQSHRPFAQVFVFPRAQSHLVAHMDHERVHAVSLDGDGDLLSFGDQLPDLLHHDGFVYCYCLCHIPDTDISFHCKSTDNFSYL